MTTSQEPSLDEAVILCGGLGTRLRPLVADRPKALVEVRGRPFVEWLLLGLASTHGIRHVILATGHLGGMIEAHFGSQPWCGIHLTYSHEPEPLGTGGALRNAVSQTSSIHLLVLNGDTYSHYDSRRLLRAHLGNAARATVLLSRSWDPGSAGTVTMDADGRINAFEEKVPADNAVLASAGVYLIERDVIAEIPGGRAISLEREVFPALVGRGLYGLEGRGEFMDIGTPESLNRAEGALAAELDELNCE